MIVPILTLVVQDPPNPLMDRFESLIGPLKSLIQCEMQPVHQLSPPMGPELVSNVTLLVWLDNPSALIATAAKAAKSMWLRLCLGGCILLAIHLACASLDAEPVLFWIDQLSSPFLSPLACL
jgi:hypothetical protein